MRFEVGDRGAYQTADFRMLDTQMQTIILKRDRFCLLVIYPHTYKQKLPIAKGSFFIALLIFKLLQPVGTFLFRFVFTGYVDGILLLIKRIDFMGHKVGNVFFIESDGADGAVLLLEMEKEFFHAEGGDGAGEAPDLAGLLAALYVVLEGFGDGGCVFVEDGEGASGGMAGPGDVQGEVVFVHVSVEGLH